MKVRKIMRSCRLISIPSHMEAMPIAWLEAMTSGVPFLGTNIGPSGVLKMEDMQF